MEGKPSDFFVKQSAYTNTVYRDVYPTIDPSSPALSLEGKVIIITGAGSGIGSKGLVPSFAAAKPKGLILIGRNVDALASSAEAARKISPGTEVVVEPASVTDALAVSKAFLSIASKFGRADVLVNNAGRLKLGNIADADPEEWWADFDVNVKGNFLMSQGFVKLLGKESKGTIINVTSALAVWTALGTSSYSVSKLAAFQMGRFIAAENENVCVIALHPGIVLTDMTTDDYKPFALDTPELVGGTCVWLSTDAARFLNGKMIHANWSVDELMTRKDEIGDDLTVAFQGNLGR